MKVISRVGANKEMQRFAALLQETKKQLNGAVLVNFALAMRNGGEIRITPQEIIDSTNGKLQVSQAENGDWVLTAIPDEDADSPWAKAALLTEEELAAEMKRRGETL